VQKNWDNSRSDPQLSLAKEGTFLGSCSVLLLEKELAASSDGAGSLGGNKTTLLTAGSVSSGGRGVTNVLMVTTTVRMLDGVHGNTSDSGPVSLLGVGSVVGAVGTEHGLVSTLTAGDNTDHSSAATDDGLADARGESDTGLLAILGVADDDSGGAGGTGEASTVTEFGLNVGDDGTLGHGVNGKDVADRQGSY
jgi:hypothetical protein